VHAVGFLCKHQQNIHQVTGLQSSLFHTTVGGRQLTFLQIMSLQGLVRQIKIGGLVWHTPDFHIEVNVPGPNIPRIFKFGASTNTESLCSKSIQSSMTTAAKGWDDKPHLKVVPLYMKMGQRSSPDAHGAGGMSSRIARTCVEGWCVGPLKP
jgi:hypothetical protein